MLDWDQVEHLAWAWKESTPREVCKVEHAIGTPCHWVVADDEFQRKCETCDSYLNGPPIPGFGWAGAVWKCPTCDNVFFGFEVPNWALVGNDVDGWESYSDICARRAIREEAERIAHQKAPHEKWLG